MSLEPRRTIVYVGDHKEGEPYRVRIKDKLTGFEGHGKDLDQDAAYAQANADLEKQIASKPASNVVPLRGGARG